MRDAVHKPSSFVYNSLSLLLSLSVLQQRQQLCGSWCVCVCDGAIVTSFLITHSFDKIKIAEKYRIRYSYHEMQLTTT